MARVRATARRRGLAGGLLVVMSMGMAVMMVMIAMLVMMTVVMVMTVVALVVQ